MLQLHVQKLKFVKLNFFPVTMLLLAFMKKVPEKSSHFIIYKFRCSPLYYTIKKTECSSELLFLYGWHRFMRCGVVFLSGWKEASEMLKKVVFNIIGRMVLNIRYWGNILEGYNKMDRFKFTRSIVQTLGNELVDQKKLISCSTCNYIW